MCLLLLHYPDVENHYSLKEVLEGTKLLTTGFQENNGNSGGC